MSADPGAARGDCAAHHAQGPLCEAGDQAAKGGAAARAARCVRCDVAFLLPLPLLPLVPQQQQRRLTQHKLQALSLLNVPSLSSCPPLLAARHRQDALSARLRRTDQRNLPQAGGYQPGAGASTTWPDCCCRASRQVRGRQQAGNAPRALARLCAACLQGLQEGTDLCLHSSLFVCRCSSAMAPRWFAMRSLSQRRSSPASFSLTRLIASVGGCRACRVRPAWRDTHALPAAAALDFLARALRQGVLWQARCRHPVTPHANQYSLRLPPSACHAHLHAPRPLSACLPAPRRHHAARQRDERRPRGAAHHAGAA